MNNSLRVEILATTFSRSVNPDCAIELQHVRFLYFLAPMAPAPLLPFSLARLRPNLRDRLWRGDTLASNSPGIPSGFQALDKELPGEGWPTHSLIELLLSAPGIGEMRLLSHSLSHLTRKGHQIIVLISGEDEGRIPYPDGWAQLGVDTRQLIVIRTGRLADHLWAIEQSLRSAAFGALLTWVPPQAHSKALRRLQLAAAGARGLSFVFRPAHARQESTSAALRLLLSRANGQDQQRVLSIHLLKRRGPTLERPIFLALPESRPFHIRPPVSRAAMFSPTGSALTFPYAMDRSLLPDIANGSHPAQAA